MNTSRFIQHEDFHGRSSNGIDPDDTRALKEKLVEPRLLSRAKSSLDISGVGLDTREVRPFEGAASLKRDTEILRIVQPSILIWENVLDVKS